MSSSHCENSSSGDNGSGVAANTHITRSRPRAQVSFRLEGPDQEDGNDPLAQSDPCTINSMADAPRNRRRLYKNFSYTSRAIRRDTLPRGQSPTIVSQHTNNSNSIHSNNHDSQASTAPRRQESFRGKHRRGGSIQPGDGGFRTRFIAYCEERTRRFSSFVNRNGSSSSSTTESSHTIGQYHIPPPEESNHSVLDALFQLYSLAFGDLAMWVYGAYFGKVLLFFFALYLTFVYCFVVLLYLVDKYYANSMCINVPEEGGFKTRAQLEFAFELSWTTFTTVGYGNVGPPPDIGCYPIRLVCSIEAILGMAFVSMCSGLFYAKLLRLLGRAPVTFSSTLCVQYGKGLEDGGKKIRPAESSNNKRKDTGVDVGSAEEKGGGGGGKFPVIEFRIVNNRANHAPGKNEIWDAEVTAIVQLSIENNPHENAEGQDGLHLNTFSRWQRPSNDVNENQSQKVYYKLALKPAIHPYFSRVWIVRHTLDATSPLLRQEVRKAIRDRPDGWDPAFNNYRDIRKCLVEFNSLRILMSGASALSRSEVYAEKIYTYEDICVGWRYVAVCYEEDSSKGSSQSCRRHQRKHIGFGDDTATRVDLSLIHDIIPQRGNDFEPVESG